MKLPTSVAALSVAAILAVLVSQPTQAKSAETDKKTKETIVTVVAGDTLTSIAEKYDLTYTRLFDANKSIANPDAIDIGDKIRIPKKDEKLATRELPAATVVSTTATTYTTRSYSSAPVNSSSYYVGNGMWCTDYVQSKRSDIGGYGNAGYNWISAAQSQGKATGSTAKKGAVAVTNGHVAYVESVNSDGSYVVSEMGWNYQAGNYNKRTVSPGEFGQFIY